MKYTFHIVDVFSSTPFGGNQLAVLPNAGRGTPLAPPTRGDSAANLRIEVVMWNQRR